MTDQDIISPTMSIQNQAEKGLEKRKVSVGRYLVDQEIILSRFDPIPNSLSYHHKNYIVNSKNYLPHMLCGKPKR